MARRAFEEGGDLVVSPMSFVVALAPLPQMRPESHDELMGLYPECNNSDEALAEYFRKSQELWNECVCLWGCVAADKTFSSSKLKAIAKAFNIEAFKVSSKDKERKKLVEEINEKVSKATEGRISNPVEDITGSIMIVNVVSFHDYWVIPFPPENTDERPWRWPDGRSDMRTFMENVITCDIWTVPGFECVTLEYVKGMRMSIFLPDSPSFEYEVSEEVIKSVFGCREKETVRVRIPKWSLRMKMKIESWLFACGFSGDLEDVQLSQTVQIDVNEEGTTAAAVTEIDGSDSWDDEGDDKERQFYADHPFAYALWDANGIFFFGHVCDPASS